MIRIEVTGKVNEFSSRKTGTVYRLQEAYAHIPGQKYPQRFEFFVPKVDGVEKVLDAGFYQPSPESFYVREGRLEFSPRLVKMEVARAAS